MLLPAWKFRRALANATKSVFVGVNSRTGGRARNSSYSARDTTTKSPFAKLLFGMVIAFISTIISHHGITMRLRLLFELGVGWTTGLWRLVARTWNIARLSARGIRGRGLGLLSHRLADLHESRRERLGRQLDGTRIFAVTRGLKRINLVLYFFHDLRTDFVAVFFHRFLTGVNCLVGDIARLHELLALQIVSRMRLGV